MPVTITADTKEARITLGNVGRVLSIASVHDIVAGVMFTSIDETFEQEGFPAGSWRRLHASTLAVRFERFQGKKATRKDGRNTVGFLRFARGGKKILSGLKNTITRESRGSELAIGSSVFYADVHQRGAVIVPKNKRALRFPIGGGQFLFRKRVVIPARPFLLFKPQDPPTIVEAIETAATDAGQGGGR